jgi:NADH-quinone oxidoreductase subunit J
MLDSFLFYTFAGAAVLSAALMVTRRNVLHSAVFLITTLLATAGIFLQLRAEFLFIAQIILYVGGIMVLFIFVIMLVRLDVALQHIRFRLQKLVALLIALALGFEVAVIFLLARHLPGQGLFIQGVARADTLPPNTEAVAQSLFMDNYLLPFEIASVLLLVAMVGAVVMAQNKKGTEES